MECECGCTEKECHCKGKECKCVKNGCEHCALKEERKSCGCNQP